MIPMARLAGYSSADHSSSYIRTVKKRMRATHCDSGGPSQLHPTLCARAPFQDLSPSLCRGDGNAEHWGTSA